MPASGASGGLACCGQFLQAANIQLAALPVLEAFFAVLEQFMVSAKI